MKKLVLFTFTYAIAVMLVIGACATVVVAQTPTAAAPKETTLAPCRLGTDWAVNPARTLAPSERVIHVTGGPVTISQREAPGSTHIVFRRCNLPETDAVIGGVMPWVKICGNDFTPEGWDLPTPSLAEAVEKAVKALPAAPPGKRGPRGFQGRDGLNGKDGKNAPAPPAPVVKKHSHKWVWWVAGAAVVSAGVGYAVWYFQPCPPGTVRK